MPTHDRDWLIRCLAEFPRARIAVFGDFCLDAYWFIDPDESELSVETGLPVRRVRDQRYTLGGAGNVLANLAALGVGRLAAVGLIGADLFGWQMRRLLAELRVDATGLLSPENWQTAVYAKPHRGEGANAREENRFDFGAFNRLDPQSMRAMLEQLGRVAAECDLVVINQQLPGGVVTPEVIEQVNRIAAEHPQTRFLADSRHRAELFRGVALKLNAREAGRMHDGGPIRPGEILNVGKSLSHRTSQPVFITRGERGIVVADQGGVYELPAAPVTGPVDPVGAGDTVVAAVAAVLACGGDALTAARLANLAASVTIQKLATTGAATPAEILAAAEPR
jgi:rfaE bifunctional protein kinase chain/domain